MKGNPWRRAEEVYQAALERQPDQRDAFVERACAGDRELLREVRSLLQYEAEVGGFLEEPAAEAATVDAGPELWSPADAPGARGPAGQRAGDPPAADQASALRRRGVPLFSWGDLEVLERVGEGGFGEVYRAWDTRLEREVALKLLLPSRARWAEDRASVVREGRILARIKNPHVVTVHGADDWDGRVGSWMELLRGRSLKQLVETQGPFGERETTIVGIDLCRALSAVHREGIVHGDVKAENVMREQGGRVVLMDFGIGVELGSDPPRRRGGTPGYMAPELLEGVAPSTRSDIYALGVLLHFLVSGSLLSVGGETDIVAGSTSTGGRSLRDERPGLSQGFLRVVERALATQPELRYGSAGEMERELAAALASSGSIPVVRRIADPTPGRRGRYLPAAAIGAAALGLAVISYLGPPRRIQ
jgi:serine/threonine-protein kinase